MKRYIFMPPTVLQTGTVGGVKRKNRQKEDKNKFFKKFKKVSKNA